MFKNYIKSAWRNLVRNKLYTIINLIGFSIALAAVFILLVYVSNEYSYDKSIPKYNQCYRIISSFENGDYQNPNIPFPLGEEIKRNFPEVEEIALFRESPRLQLKSKDDYSSEEGIHSVSKEFLNLMGVQLLEGNPTNPLPDAYSIVINEKIANKYFGKRKPIGQKLSLKNKKFVRELTVTGVIKDLPENLTYGANAFLHMDLGVDLLFGNMITYGSKPTRSTITENWGFSTLGAIVRLQEGTSPETFESKLNKHLHQLRGDKYQLIHSLQAIKDAHLYSDHLQNLHKTPGNRKLMFLLLSVAILILIVASINYIILNTATSMKRTLEMGMRRVLGAQKASLRKQLLLESILLSLICFPLALTLAELIIPYLHQLFGIEIIIHYGSNTILIAIFALLTLLAGLLSGTYLSVFLAKVEPIELIKSKKLNQSIHNIIRKSLILIQLIIFIALSISSLLIKQQLDYISVKDLGYNKEALLIIPLRGTEMEKKYSWLKDQLSKSSLITNISGAMSCPPSAFTMQMNIPHPNQPEKKIGLQFFVTDENFVKTMGMQMIEGQSFSSDKHAIQSGVILNESAVKFMNLVDPIGKNTTLGTIVGIVKDFHPQGLTEAIPPACIQKVEKANIKSQIKELIIRTRPESLKATMQLIRKVWKQKAPECELHMKFSDERLSRLYQKEQKFSKLFQSFTIMAIFIAALGLFGFSLFMVEQRTQEIGIRKVMGANIGTIIAKFVTEYTKLILIAFLVSAPLSWYFIHKILANYVYRAPINPWYFIMGLLAAFIIVLISISGNIYKAANQNPVESLKHE
jgi:putative ABC transport system permease protein